MKRIINSPDIAAFACCTALTLAACGTMADIHDPDAIGELSKSPVYAREIVINSETKWINASQYELVKITHSATGKSFVWNFSIRGFAVFDLSAVAPAGVIPPGQHVIAYVSENVREGFM